MLFTRLGRHRRFKLIFALGLLLAVLNSESIMRFVGKSFKEGRVFASSEKFKDREKLFGRKTITDLISRHSHKQRDLDSDSKLDKISVCVVGEVVFPGQYDLLSSSTALKAVVAAGGPGDNGSYRVVKVFKDDFCQEFDLYDFFMSGKDESPALNGGETVVVESARCRVSVGNNLEAATIYELKASEKNLASVFKYSETPDNSENLSLRVFRSKNGRLHNVFSLPCGEIGKAAFQNFQLEDGDKIEIAEDECDLKREIELCGHFKHCGKIVSNRELRLSEFISSDYLKEGFAPEYGEILRPGKEREEFDVISFSVENVLAGGEGAQIMLRDKDRIVVFSQEVFGKSACVAIEQGIRGKQVFPWHENMRISDLIGRAGGLEKHSSIVAELIRKKIEDGRVKTRTIIVDLSRIWSGDIRHDMVLEPFDLLLIKHAQQN